MAKELKKIIVKDLERRTAGIEGCVLIDYQGLDSEKTTDLRNELRDNGIAMTVLHNRLTKIALAERPEIPAGFGDLLRGPTAMLSGEDGVFTASRSISRWRKKNQGLARVKGGFFEGSVLSAADVERFASVPDLPTLQGQLASLFGSPLAVLVSAARTLTSSFAGAARSRHEDLESEAK